MSKLLRFALAILFILGIAGVSFADNIPSVVDPKNHRVVWTANVYNGSGAEIVSGYIVEWDFDTANSTALDGRWYDDMCPYVQLCDGASDIWTAGVVPYGKNIADGDVGSIIIRGPAYVLKHSTPPAVNNMCGSHTDGTVTTDAASANTCALGITIKATAAAGTGPDQNSSTSACTAWAVIYVEPTQEAD